MLNNSTIIPLRFLAITLHLILTIISHLTMQGNLLTSTPLQDPLSLFYNSAQSSLTAAIISTYILLLIEIIGFFASSMFNCAMSVLSILVHGFADFLLCFYLVGEWHYLSFWYIFSTCVVCVVFEVVCFGGVYVLKRV